MGYLRIIFFNGVLLLFTASPGLFMGKKTVILVTLQVKVESCLSCITFLGYSEMPIIAVNSTLTGQTS